MSINDLGVFWMLIIVGASLTLALVVFLISTRKHWCRHHRQISTVVIVACSLTCGALWYYRFGPGFYGEFEEIKALLEEMPGVELVSAGGYADGMQFEGIWAKVRLANGGEVEFCPLSLGSFDESSHLGLNSIGGIQVIIEGEGEVGVYNGNTGEPIRTRFCSHGLDVGPASPFARMFPFTMPNPQSVIARYDEIVAILREWAIQPDYDHLRSVSGTDYYYGVKDPSLNQDWLDPVELLRK